MVATPVQLSLGVSLNEDTTFANFHCLPDNAQALDHLQKISTGAEPGNLLLWAPPGAGVSHLLQAVCHRAHSAGRQAQYIPLAELAGFEAQQVLEGLEGFDLICLDNIECVRGLAEWEQTLFHLYNRMKDAGRSLIFGSEQSPASLQLTLPDLKSRLLASVVYHVEPLDDEGKAECLRLRAHARGMELPADVASYILNRASRSTHELFALLDTLDVASLQQQRKLTVPFVKSILGL